jgi:hypothetical protein
VSRVLDVRALARITADLNSDEAPPPYARVNAVPRIAFFYGDSTVVTSICNYLLERKTQNPYKYQYLYFGDAAP